MTEPGKFYGMAKQWHRWWPFHVSFRDPWGNFEITLWRRTSRQTAHGYMLYGRRQ